MAYVGVDPSDLSPLMYKPEIQTFPQSLRLVMDNTWSYIQSFCSMAFSTSTNLVQRENEVKRCDLWESERNVQTRGKNKLIVWMVVTERIWIIPNDGNVAKFMGWTKKEDVAKSVKQGLYFVAADYYYTVS